MSTPQLVLVAEDDPAVAEFLQLAFRAMGHDVLVAADGQAALDSLAENTPQLAMVDALLPKLDGFAVLRGLRKALPQLPVVMMSGIYKKRSYQQEAIDLGAREYLFKPLSVLKVWELAEHHLGEAAPGAREPEGFAGTPLGERPLAQVLAELHAARSTGMLFVRGPRGAAILFVEDGRIVFGRNNDPKMRLDRILDKQGALSAEARRRARELLAKNKGRARFGDLLVEAGLLSAEQLQAALSEQQRQHVTRPLTWTEGRSQFFESDAPRHESFKLDLDMEALIVWAGRHVPAGPALDSWLPRPECRLRVKGDLQAEATRFSLRDRELDLLQLADGSRSVGALRAMGRLAQVDVDRLAAALTSIGRLEVLPPESARAPNPSTAFASAPSAGSLASHPPAGVLLGTSFGGRTGCLRFEGSGANAEVQRTVWFDEGRIAFANSSDPQDRLGQVLLRRRLASSEQLRTALETARSNPGTALGRVLVDQGALQLDDLHRALVAQVREVVAGALQWNAGTFYFTSGPLPTQEIVPLALEPLELVLDALREMSVSSLSTRLPEQEARLRKTWQCFELAEQFALTPLEDRLLGELDSTPTLGGLLDSPPEGPEAVLRGLNLLLCLGLVEPAPAEQDSGTRSSPDVDFTAIDDESFDDESFEDVAPASNRAAMDDESFEDAGEAASEPPRPAGTGGPVTGCEESFAGLADEPELRGLVNAEPESPVTGGEESFAGLADEPELRGLVNAEPASTDSGAGRAAAEEPLPELDFGNLESLGQDAPVDGAGSGPVFDLEGDLAPSAPSSTLGAAVGPPARTGGSGRAEAARSAATAVLEAPGSDAQLLFALHDFLALLSDHLATHPGSIPEHVLATLPPELRERFGM